MIKRSKRLKLYTKKDIPYFNKTNMELFKKYIANLGMRELSKNTIYGYERDLYSWFGYIYKYQDNKSVHDLNEDDVTEYLYYCKKEGNHSRRMRRRIASVSAFYIFLRKKRILKENICDFLDRPENDTDILTQTYLTPEQIKDLKAKLFKLNKLQVTTYALLSLSTMARVTAISNIKWSQIDFNERVINDVIEKEGYNVTLYFSEEVKTLLMDLKKSRNEKGIECEYVFISKYRGQYKQVDVSTLGSWTKRCGALINVPTLHPHDFRHSMATILKNNGMPLEQVSALLNHKGVDVTIRHYIREDKKKISSMKDKFELLNVA